MRNEPIHEWARGRTLAPSIQRTDPLGWAAASSLLGLLAAWTVLWLLWRPLPGVVGPPGALAQHVEHWAKLGAQLLSSRLFEQDAATYSRFWAQCSDAEKLAIGWRCVVGACAACVPAWLLVPSFLSPRDALIHLRGARRFEERSAVRELRSRFVLRSKARPDFEIAPNVPFPADMWTRHVLIVGGVGSGKSTVMRPLIDKVVSSGDQLLLFDPKSEFTIGFGAPAILAPWDARSLAWDLARDMRNALDMRRFAASVIKDSQDPMWSNASRQLLVGLMLYLKGTRRDDWGWSELADLLSQPQAVLLPIMREWHPEAARSVEKATVTTAGILINLAAFCAPVFDLARAWEDVEPERRISFVEWTLGRSPIKQIILQGHGAYGELTKAYVEGIVGVVSAIVNSVEMRDDPNRKLWLIADEFGMMGKVPVRPLFEVGRSRGFRCVVATQDLAQLEEIHGAPLVKALVSMCGTLLVGQVMPGETAKALCDAFGTREVERTNVSTTAGASGESKALSFNREEVALYKPSELASRLGLTPDGRGVKLILFTGGDAFEIVWPHFDMREEREGHVPAQWTLGARAPLPRELASNAPQGSAAASADVAASDESAAGQEAGR
ncbi:MAG: type IV secretion system DNA-binding domain-containing protein [Ramlibacter sp.]